MLLAIDVGNTNIALGVYDGDRLVADWRIRTECNRTADEYGMLLLQLFAHSGLSVGDIRGIAVSNVVPTMLSGIREMSLRFFNQEPYIVEPDAETAINIRYDPKSAVGADRIVNAVATFALYGGPAIVVDFGTATTFDAISASGDYLGGAISPGIGISMEALFRAASRLPRVSLTAPASAIGTTTEMSMQAGMLYGFAGQVDAIVARFRKELGVEAKVIATGGLASLIAPETHTVQIVNPLLTLEGLRLMWEQNKGVGA